MGDEEAPAEEKKEGEEAPAEGGEEKKDENVPDELPSLPDKEGGEAPAEGGEPAPEGDAAAAPAEGAPEGAPDELPPVKEEPEASPEPSPPPAPPGAAEAPAQDTQAAPEPVSLDGQELGLYTSDIIGKVIEKKDARTIKKALSFDKFKNNMESRLRKDKEAKKKQEDHNKLVEKIKPLQQLENEWRALKLEIENKEKMARLKEEEIKDLITEVKELVNTNSKSPGTKARKKGKKKSKNSPKTRKKAKKR